MKPYDVSKKYPAVPEGTVFAWHKAYLESTQNDSEGAKPTKPQGVQPLKLVPFVSNSVLTGRNDVLWIKEQLRSIILDPAQEGSGTASNACRVYLSAIELEKKIAPPTAKELAEFAVSLGYGPQDFMNELANAWEKTKAS